MQVWLDGTQQGDSESEKISRRWYGNSSDVSEILIEDRATQAEAMSMIGLVPWILIRCPDWSMVPLENLVASSRGTGTRIAIAVAKEIDLNGVSYALGIGADAVLVPSGLVSEAEKIAAERLYLQKERKHAEVSFTYSEVSGIETCGMGERVCVDLTRRLKIGQGMAIGSISSMLCLVHGETVESEYVPTRPFRVNAGSVHSYTLMSDGSTKYLSELKSGDEVAVVSEDGICDIARIGRLKIENRPMVLLRYFSSDLEGQIVLQQAETVRLVSSEGKLVSITEIQAGDTIAVISDNRFRHTGIAVEGKVVEK